VDILISNSSGIPIYEQIVVQIKNKILSESLRDGEPLPSMRLLAKELRISVITTKRAYEELEREGFITSVMGKGSFVASKNTELIKEEQLRIVESQLDKAVTTAKSCGISLSELQDILSIVYGDE
jgi:GntR family transcriptional regulator